MTGSPRFGVPAGIVPSGLFGGAVVTEFYDTAKCGTEYVVKVGGVWLGTFFVCDKVVMLADDPREVRLALVLAIKEMVAGYSGSPRRRELRAQGARGDRFLEQ